MEGRGVAAGTLAVGGCSKGGGDAGEAPAPRRIPAVGTEPVLRPAGRAASRAGAALQAEHLLWAAAPGAAAVPVKRLLWAAAPGVEDLPPLRRLGELGDAGGVHAMTVMATGRGENTLFLVLLVFLLTLLVLVFLLGILCGAPCGTPCGALLGVPLRVEHRHVRRRSR